MREVKKIKSAEMFPFIKEILSGGRKVWITVTGMSMYPFLREDKDCALLAPVNFNSIRKGDIVLIQRPTGEYILHRVLRKNEDNFYIIGDAQQWIEGPLKPEQLVATVTAVKREGHEFDCNNSFWKLLTGIWINIIPLRHIIIKIIRIFRRRNENTQRL